MYTPEEPQDDDPKGGRMKYQAAAACAPAAAHQQQYGSYSQRLHHFRFGLRGVPRPSYSTSTDNGYIVIIGK